MTSRSQIARSLLLATTLMPAVAFAASAQAGPPTSGDLIQLAQIPGIHDSPAVREQQKQKEAPRPPAPEQQQAPRAAPPAPPAQPRAEPQQQRPAAPPAARPEAPAAPRPAAPPSPQAQPPAPPTPPAAQPRQQERPQRMERPERQERGERPSRPENDMRPERSQQPDQRGPQQRPGAPEQKAPPPAATQRPAAPPPASPPAASPPPAAQQPPAAQRPSAPPPPAAGPGDRRGDNRPGQPDARPDPRDPRFDQQRNEQVREWRNRRLDDVRQERREERQGNQLIIREPGRTIIQEGDRTIVRHNEADRFRAISRDVRTEQRGRETITTIPRPGGFTVLNVVGDDGRLLRRVRRGPDGREIVIIDNRRAPQARPGAGFFVTLPPPRISMPRDRYIVEYEDAQPEIVYETLMAPPVERLQRAYSLDEIRYSESVRDRMPRIDLDTVTFATGSWEIDSNQIRRLEVIADGINRAIRRNPAEVFLIEGHTDAVGSDVDNLSLSDRRAESVAVVLSEEFQVPPENLTTQGYGEQYLKVQTDGPSEANRRVTVRRITPLLTGQMQGAPPPAPRPR